MFEQQLISEYTPDYYTTDAWGLKLLSWCSICGIRELPDPITESYLVEALMNDFNGHSFAEIEVALYMYAMRELSPEIEAYNQLNVKFLATIMKEYRVFRKNTAEGYQEIVFMLEKPKPVVLTDFAKDMQIGQAIWDNYVDICNEREIWGGASKYEFLERYEVVQTNPDEIAEELEAAKERLRTQLAAELDSREQDRLRAILTDETRLELTATIFAKDILYRAWLMDIAMRHDMVVGPESFEEFTNTIEDRIFRKYGEVKQPIIASTSIPDIPQG